MTDVLPSLSARWIPIPDAAEELGSDFRTVRNWVREGELVALRVPGLAGARIPGEFFTGARESFRVVDGLRGSITQLRDCGLDDAEIVTWLLSPNEELGMAPAAALASGLKHAVRRAAVALAL